MFVFNIRIIFLIMSYGKFTMMLVQHSVNSDWLFNTHSRVLQVGWFILEINEGNFEH